MSNVHSVCTGEGGVVIRPMTLRHDGRSFPPQASGADETGSTPVTLSGTEGGNEGGGLPSHVLDVDCSVRGRSRSRFTTPSRY